MNRSFLCPGAGHKKRLPALSVFFAVIMLSMMILPVSAGMGEEAALNVSLFRHVPDQERFERAIESLWYRDHPDVKLNFVTWHSYHEDPPEDLDVFVYDSIFLYDFLEKGFLLPLSEEDIQNAGDLVPCALSACMADGVAYAVPQLLCTNLLFAREGDDAVADVQNVRELYQLIGDCEDLSIPPSAGDTLLVDLSDSTMLMFLYLEVRTDVLQEYSEWVSVPEAGALEPDVLGIMLEVEAMGGNEQIVYITPDDDDYIRAEWFADGSGRALIGYSENLSAMGDEAGNMTFHRISFSDGENVPMLYADFASVNANIDSSRKGLALELLNLITGEEMMTLALSSAQEGQSPQYLLSARRSVYDHLSEEWPIFEKLKEIVSDPQSRVYLIQPSGRELIENAERTFGAPL